MKLHCILIAVICLTCAIVTAQVPQSERLSVDFYLSEEYQTLKEEILETTKQYYKARELRDSGIS